MGFDDSFHSHPFEVEIRLTSLGLCTREENLGLTFGSEDGMVLCPHYRQIRSAGLPTGGCLLRYRGLQAISRPWQILFHCKQIPTLFI